MAGLVLGGTSFRASEADLVDLQTEEWSCVAVLKQRGAKIDLEVDLQREDFEFDHAEISPGRLVSVAQKNGTRVVLSSIQNEVIGSTISLGMRRLQSGRATVRIDSRQLLDDLVDGIIERIQDPGEYTFDDLLIGDLVKDPLLGEVFQKVYRELLFLGPQLRFVALNYKISSSALYRLYWRFRPWMLAEWFSRGGTKTWSVIPLMGGIYAPSDVPLNTSSDLDSQIPSFLVWNSKAAYSADEKGSLPTLRSSLGARGLVIPLVVPPEEFDCKVAEVGLHLSGGKELQAVLLRFAGHDGFPLIMPLSAMGPDEKRKGWVHVRVPCDWVLSEESSLDGEREIAVPVSVEVYDALGLDAIGKIGVGDGLIRLHQ